MRSGFRGAVLFCSLLSACTAHHKDEDGADASGRRDASNAIVADAQGTANDAASRDAAVSEDASMTDASSEDASSDMAVIMWPQGDAEIAADADAVADADDQVDAAEDVDGARLVADADMRDEDAEIIDADMRISAPDACVDCDDAGHPIVHACDELAGADTALQIAIVESNTTCAQAFVTAMENDPEAYLAAFYTLVSSPVASDALWGIVYDELRFGRFVFDAPIVADLFENLADAVPECPITFRCTDWHTWIVAGLERGDMFQCPSASGMTREQLLQALPFGDYDCTESFVAPLAGFADSELIDSLLTMTESAPLAWSRRNGARVIGRFAERDSSDAAHVLVTTTRREDVTGTFLSRLSIERDQNVLNDLVWVLDAQFFPFFDAQPALEAISADAEFDDPLRFRAITAIERLFESKMGMLSTHDENFMTGSLASDNYWVRAQAAFACYMVPDVRIDTEIRERLAAALHAAYASETMLAAKVQMARAIDRFDSTTLMSGLKTSYEAEHLGNVAAEGDFTIRSGLPMGELAEFLDLMTYEREAFFDLLGPAFTTPVPGDTNPTMTLMLFATRAEYIEYMDGFIGYGGAAGGLYLEDRGILYTYQRTIYESRFTVEQLIQHEFGHYLQGRFVYPDAWGASGYFDEPKAWADEGFGEFLGGLSFDESGDYTPNVRGEHLDTICAAPFRDLSALLTQTVGYNVAGVFDYSNGWAFSYFLFTQKQTGARAIYEALRNRTYHYVDFASIAGESSLESLNDQWHMMLSDLCAEHL